MLGGGRVIYFPKISSESKKEEKQKKGKKVFLLKDADRYISSFYISSKLPAAADKAIYFFLISIGKYGFTNNIWV